MPARGVSQSADAKDAEQFERGFASATRTDELRATGQLNLASPWTKAVHGERAYYRRLRSDPVGAFARTTEATLLMPTEGLKAVQMLDAEDFELGFARATRLDELRSAGQLNLESPWMQAIHGDRSTTGGMIPLSGLWRCRQRVWRVCGC